MAPKLTFQSEESKFIKWSKLWSTITQTSHVVMVSFLSHWYQHLGQVSLRSEGSPLNFQKIHWYGLTQQLLFKKGFICGTISILIFFVNRIAWSLEHVILTCIMSNNSNYESDETFLISIFFGHSSYLRNLFRKRFSISSTHKHFAIKNVTYVKKNMSKDLVHNDQKLSGYCNGFQVFDQFWCRCLF